MSQNMLTDFSEILFNDRFGRFLIQNCHIIKKSWTTLLVLNMYDVTFQVQDSDYTAANFESDFESTI